MIEELGLCQSKILLVQRQCWLFLALSPLLSKHLSPLILDKGKTSPGGTYLESFLCTFSKKWPRLCLPNCKKTYGQNTNQCVQLRKVLYFSDLPSSLLVAFVSLGTASWIIPSGRVIVLCQICSLSSQFSFIQCWFFLRASFILLLTFLLLLLPSWASTVWPLQ